MRDLSGTGQVYRFTLSQLLKSRANRVTLIIMVLLAAVSMPLTALLGGETPETSDTAGLASVRVDNRTDLVLDYSGDAYWADTDFSADAGEPDAVMGETAEAAATNVGAGTGEPVLYIEFRKDGVSIDPTPWWKKPQSEKVRG